MPFANITLLVHSVFLVKISQALLGKWNKGYINCFILMVNEFCVAINEKNSQIFDFGGHSFMYSPSQLITINIVSWWRAAMIVWNVMINSKVIVVRQMTGWLGLPWSGNIFDKLSKSVKSQGFLISLRTKCHRKTKILIVCKKAKANIHV